MDQHTNPTAPAGQSAARIWAGIWVIYLVWGSTYLGIAVAVQSIPPFVMASFRFLLAGGILLLWTLLRERRTWRRPSLVEVRDTAVVGALLLGGGMGLVAYGEQSVPSGVTAVLVAMMPLWLALFGRVIFGDRLPRPVVGGILLGLVGVVVLAWPGDAALGGADPLHLLAIVVSPMSWALGTLFAARRARLPSQPLFATGLQMTLGGVVLAGMALASGELVTWDPASTTPDSLAAFVYLTLIGSLLGFTVYAWLVQVAPLPRLSTYAYVNPIVAVILGTLLHGEALTGRTLVAGGIIIAAVIMIVTARGRVASRRAPQTMERSRADASAPPGGSAPADRRTGDAAHASSGELALGVAIERGRDA